MIINMKDEIIKNICYSELVYGRINKKLNIHFSHKQIEEFVYKILMETQEQFFIKRGKNYYIKNTENNVRLTINSNTCRIITVDKLQKK
jgi:hypothetical protein